MLQLFAWLGTIWPPDLSQFLPDLVNALVTGAILALVVWKLQQRREREQDERSALDGWDRLRVGLRPLFQADHLVMVPGRFDFTTGAHELREALKPWPVQEWRRQAPKCAAIGALAALEQEWPLLVEAQHQLTALIPSAVAATRPASAGNAVDDLVAGLVPGRMLEEALDDEVSFAVLRERLPREAIEGWLTKVVDRPEIVAAGKKLFGSYFVTNRAYREVRAAVMR